MHSLSYRALRSAARHFRSVAVQQRSAPVASQRHFWEQVRSKSTTASSPTPAAVSKAPTSTPSTSVTSGLPQATKAAQEAAVAADNAAATGAAQPSVREGVSAPNMPDVHSTSLGIEDPDANDPLKWRKFVWKYAGAVVVFLIAYKSVNWYVDKLEAEGKRQREELEENKILKEEFEADKEKAQAMLAMAQGNVVPADAPGGAQDNQVQAQKPFALFKTIQEEEGYISELDELRALQMELEAKLKILKREKYQTDDIKSKQWEIEGELKDLGREMAELEKVEEQRKTP